MSQHFSDDVEGTMRSVYDLIETVTDLHARKVCHVIADLLKRALEENRELRARVADLEGEVAKLRAENAELRAENAELRAEVVRLKEENAWLRRQLFGDTREALTRQLPLGGPSSSSSSEAAALPDPVDEKKLAEAKELQKKARAMAREAMGGKSVKKPPSSPRITSEMVRHRVPKGMVCVSCGGDVKDRGMKRTASELDVVPATFIRREYLLHEAGCECGHVSFVMPGPERGLEKTTASARLIAEIAVDKFQYHFPVHRQDAWLRAHGVDLSRSTVNGWILRGALTLEPVWKAICQAARAEKAKQVDESPVCVVTGGESKDCFLWCLLSELAIAFDLTETRNQQVAAKILGKTGETTLTDGHAVYSKKSVPGKHGNCHAHARRKFFDALVSFPKEAFAVLLIFHDLFMVEREADVAGMDAETRLALRKRKSVSLMNELSTLVQSFNPPPRSSLGKAIKYLQKRWKGLTLFLEDGRVPLSNNAVESRFKEAKLGFKNFLFAQSELGCDAVAIYYTLIATARLHGLDPAAYLEDVLRKLTAGHPASRLSELLPWNWRAPEVSTDEDEMPPMARDEAIPAERVVQIRKLQGKVRLAKAAAADPPTAPPGVVQKTAVF